MNMFDWIIVTHSRLTHTQISCICTQLCLSVVKWIVGHFVAFWEVLSLDSIAQLTPSSFLFVYFYFLTSLPLVQQVHPSVSQKCWLHRSPPSLVPLLPQLDRKTHYLLEDKSQCQSFPFLTSLFIFPLLSSVLKTPPSYSLSFSSLFSFFLPQKRR